MGLDLLFRAYLLNLTRTDTRKLPKMPSPAVYEQEYIYWPWGRLLKEAADWTARVSPKSGVVIDYMCGTGYLLHEIGLRRPDLELAGCSLEPRSYIDYANLHYPEADVVYQDALAYRPRKRPDVVLCTAGIHHLVREQQPRFIAKVAEELPPAGLFLIGEEIIGEYQNELERRIAALEMCADLVLYAIKSEAPDEIIEATVDVTSNDLLENGEYKFSKSNLLSMVSPFFDIVDFTQIWPEGKSMQYGDIILSCRRKRHLPQAT